jgi:hypothetical protein
MLVSESHEVGIFEEGFRSKPLFWGRGATKSIVADPLSGAFLTPASGAFLTSASGMEKI